MANKQPFYHRIEFLFTATDDVCDKLDSPEFAAAFEKFLRRQFPRTIVSGSVEHDTPASAEPGDPADLM